MRYPIHAPMGRIDGPTLPKMAAFSTTALKNDTGAIMHTVVTAGAALLTRHQRPIFVMLTIERYADLERQAQAGSHQLPEIDR